MSFLALVLGVMNVASAATETYTVIPSESVFAVVTHKTGIAAGLAHNHFVFPGRYTAEASVDQAHLEQAHFRLQFQTTDLVADGSAEKNRWFPGVKADGILDDPFPEISEKDRGKIRESMLGKDQLDARRFPEIVAELKRISQKSATAGSKSFAYEAIVALTVHGTTVERPFLLNIQQTGDTARIEGVGSFTFTAFGIKPFSGFLGAVRNEDVFHVFVDMKAKRQ